MVRMKRTSFLSEAKSADAIIIALDLANGAGSALARGMSELDAEVKQASALARFIRNRYLVVVKDMIGHSCTSVPCWDMTSLRECIDHSYRLISKRATKICFLVIPPELSAHVYGQVAITRAQCASSRGTSRTGGQDDA